MPGPTPAPSPAPAPSPSPGASVDARFSFSAHAGSPLQIDFRDSSQGPVATWRWDFGDGSPHAASQHPVHRYPGAGAYVVSLEVADGGGGADSAAQLVAVYDAPPAGFTARPDPADVQTVILSGPPAAVYANPMGGTPPPPTIDTWSWDLGDGNRLSGQSVTHRYAAQGRYSVTLQTGGPGGTAAETADIVVGNAPPAMNFSSAPAPLDPQRIQFQDGSSGAISTWAWDFGDGASSADRHPAHAYARGGTYTVTLTGSGPGGTHSVAKTLTVMHRTPAPSIAHNLAGAPFTVKFAGSAAEAVTDWEWDFGDFNQATGQDPSHTYAAAGAYTVTLKARGPGGEGTATTVVALGIAPPTVDFTHAPATGLYAVRLAPTATGTVSRLEVRFGDGDDVELVPANPSAPVFAPLTHVYPGAGDYPVTLLVYGPAGDTSTTRVVTVAEPPLTPSIAVQPAGGAAPLSVAFDGASGGNVRQWTWDFGDGATASGEDVNHVYRAAGNYTATLTVTGPAGSQTATRAVAVAPASLQAAADASPTTGDAGMTVTFTDRSISNGTLRYAWDFGDGASAAEPSPTHTYRDPGNYLATLTITDAATAASDSASIPITVRAIPLDARIEAPLLQASAPFTLYAEDDSAGSVTGWSWNFGDGSAAFTTADPDQGRRQSHTYTAPGRYLLSLTVSGPLPSPADRDTATVEVVVTDPAVIPPTARINATPVVGSSPHAVSFTDVSSGTYSSVRWDFDDGTTSTSPTPTHTFASGGDYLVRLTLLGPPPNRFPLGTASEVISVDIGPLPDIGPPSAGSTGGVATAAVPRPAPGSGGTGGGPSPWPLPGSANAQPGPGWSQASVLRYEPTANLSFAEKYRVVRSQPGTFGAAIACGGPCGSEACGLTLESAHGTAAVEMLSLAAATTPGSTAYLAVTEQQRVVPLPIVAERQATTLMTLSAAGSLSVSQRVVLDPYAYLAHLPPSLQPGSPFLQRDLTSFVVDDLIVLANGTVVIAGRVRLHFDYGGPVSVTELPGLYAVSPATGALQWSLYGDPYEPGLYETTEVRANIVGGRFLLWVLRGNTYSATQADGVVYEGRVPNAGEHLLARRAAEAVNDLDLVDYAVGPDENVYFVAREEAPLACYDQTLDSYQLRVFDKNFSRELALPTPLELDYYPQATYPYGVYSFRTRPERRLLVEPDGADVRVVLHGAVWPDDKEGCALYKGSAANPYPAYGDGCPVDIIKRFCCDDPAVAARQPGACTGAADEGACPCRGVDPAQVYCAVYPPSGVCERPGSPFALEQVVLRANAGPVSLRSDEGRHRIAAVPAGGLYAGAGAAERFVQPLTLTSDGRGRVTYAGRNGTALIRLDDPDQPDLELVDTWNAAGSVLTDRGTTPRSIHGVSGSFRVYRHDPAAGINIEESWAWPIVNNGATSVVLPVGAGRLLRLGGNISYRGGLTVHLYEPAATWLGPVFADHAAPSPQVALCRDSDSDPASTCAAYPLFAAPHDHVWGGYAFCRDWGDPDCEGKFLDLWEFQHWGSLAWRMPDMRNRLVTRSDSLVSSSSTSTVWIPSARFPSDSVHLGGIQPRCASVDSRVVETRTVCINWDSAASVCRQTELQERKEFRCEEQNEVRLPVFRDNGVTPWARGWERFHLAPGIADACPEVGLPSPVLTVTYPGPAFAVTETTSGATSAVSVQVPSAGEVNFKIVSGDAELAGGGREVTVAGSGTLPFTVEAHDSTTAIVEVTWTEATTRRREQKSLALAFARPGLPCRREGNGFRLCTVRHPGPVLAESDQPARHAPALVAQDVDLATRAYWSTEIDVVLPSIDVPLTVARHYLPPRRPAAASPDPSFNPLDEGAELGPGWRLNLIQWLLPITPGTDTTALEDPANGFDLALHADGRVDTFRYPASGPVTGALTGDARLFLYDDASGTLVEKNITASVVTYESPRGFEGTLRGYTINPDANGSTTAVHPFYDPARPEVGPEDQRFYVLTEYGGEMRVFNCNGQLIRLITPQRHEMRFLYDGPKDRATGLRVLSGVVDTNGRLTTVSWYLRAAGPRLRDITLPDGRKVEYTYRSTPQRPDRLGSVIRNFDGRFTLSTSTNPPPIDPAVHLRHGYGYTADDLLRFIYVVQDGHSVVVLLNGYQGQDLVWQETGAGRDNLDTSIAQDGGLTQIAYNNTGAVLTDAAGGEWRYELRDVQGGGSAKVIDTATVTAEVYNGDLANPSASLQPLLTRYDYDGAGRVTLTDPPGPASTRTVYNDRGDLVQRVEQAGADTRTWTWDYDYDGPCPSRIEATDPVQAVTVTAYYPFDASRPGQTCQVQEITEPRVTDPDGTAHIYKNRLEYYGAQQNATADDRLLRGMVARAVRSEENGSSRIQETTTRYWITSGSAPGMPGRTAYTRLGLPQVVTVSGDVPGQCSGNVPAQRETHQEYDERGNVTLIRRIVDPANPANAWEERRVYDQADRLHASTENGVTTEYAYNERGQLQEIITEARDLFDGAALAQPTFNAPRRKSVVRMLYQHNGERYAVLEGTITGAGQPEFHTFEFTAHDGLSRPVLSIAPAAGLSDADRYRMLRALLDACPGQRTPSSGPTCPMKALADAGWTRPAISAAAIQTAGAPLGFTRMHYTKDGMVRSARVHDGTAGLDPAAGGQLARAFYDDARRPRLSESGALSQSGTPVRETSEYNDFGELTQSVLHDPDGCRAGFTPVRTSLFQDRDALGRPKTIVIRGDNGAVADVTAAAVDASACSTNAELARTEIEYDEIGRLRSSTRHVHVINGSGASRTLAFSYTYGPLGHTAAEQVASKRERDYADYAGAVCASHTTTAASGAVLKSVDYRLDGLSRVTRESVRHRDVIGHGLGEPAIGVEFGYDAQGNRNLIRDGLGRETRRHFDALGRMRVEETFNDVGGQVQQYEIRYDDAGNAAQEYTFTADGRRGVHRSFVANHLVEETTTLDGTWSARRRFVLDHRAEPIRIYPHGVDGEVLIRELDEAGRLRRETLSIAGTHRAVKSFRYDALDNVTRLDAVDRSQPRISPWDETKRYRYNGLGDLTHAQNEIRDPLSSANARNGVVSNVWMVRDSLGNVRVEGTRLFDRDVAVADRDNVVTAEFDAVGKIRSLEYDPDINAANRPRLEYGYDPGLRLTGIRALGGVAFDRFEMKHSGDYVMRRQQFDAAGSPGHATDYAFDRLLRRYKVEHTLDDVRIESRQWFRNGTPVWTRNVSWRRDGGNWIANADDNLMAYPDTQCGGSPGARIRGSAQRAVAELTMDPCFSEESAVRVMGPGGWDVVDETGVIGSRFTGHRRDMLGRELSTTNISYAGEIDDDASPSVTRRRIEHAGGRIAREQNVEIGARITFFNSHDWGVRAITDVAYAYEGLPLLSGIECANGTGALDTSAFRRLCGAREYRFVRPPIARFPGAAKPFDAINIAGIWRTSELKTDQVAGMTANPPTAPGGPEPALYRHRYGPLGGPAALSDDITRVRKYDVEYDLFGRQVYLHDNHYLGPKAPGVNRVTHRFLYDAQDRLIYEDYRGLDTAADDISYAPAFYGYYGKDLIREHLRHPDYGDNSDRVYVYGPGADLVYTARMGQSWDAASEPPIAHMVLEDIGNSVLSLYFQRGGDGAYHRLAGEIKGSKVRNYVKGEVAQSLEPVSPWWNPALAAGAPLDDDEIREPFKQLAPRLRSSPFDEMMYAGDAGFLRSRSASWRTNEWVAMEITQGEWLQQAADAQLTATIALVAGALVSGGYSLVGLAAGEAGLAYLVAGTAIGLSTSAIDAYGLHGKVQDEGWTDENKTAAGWLAFGVASDLATLGGTRFVTAARVAEAAQQAALAYQLPHIAWSAMGMDAALGDNCFVAGTPVWTETGMRPIEEIKVGDRVWSWDERTGETTLQPVLQTFVNAGRELVTLHVDGEQIVTTPEHPFWVMDKGWVLAADLADGDALGGSDGAKPVRAEIAAPGGDTPIFNIDVAGGDTYFVGQSRLLVHNQSGRIAQAAIRLRAARHLLDRESVVQDAAEIALRSTQGRRISQAVGRLGAIQAGVVKWKDRGLRRLGKGVHGPREKIARHRFYFDRGQLTAQSTDLATGLVRTNFDRLSARVLEGIHMMPLRAPSSGLRRSLERILRGQGGMHEMLPVKTAAHMRRIGVTFRDIDRLRIPTGNLRFVLPGIPPGYHHRSTASTVFHKVLSGLLETKTNRMEAIHTSVLFHRLFATW